MQPFISVIIPVYNAEKYLDRCFESIVNQTYGNLEIIAVDDGSTDNSPAMCDKWAEQDERIKALHKKNGGAASARNEGLRIASGEYVGFVDADDYIDADMYEKLYRAIIDSYADVANCSYRYFDENYSHIKDKIFDYDVIEAPNIFQSFIFATGIDDNAIWNKLYKREAIGDIRFNTDFSVGEDLLFNNEVISGIQRIVSMSEPLYNYLVVSSSLNHRVSDSVLSRWKCHKYILENSALSENDYSLALQKYQMQLFTCLRELLKTKDKQLIRKHYPEICQEIKQYYNGIIRLSGVSGENMLSLKLIHIHPSLFKAFYKIYLLFRG